MNTPHISPARSCALPALLLFTACTPFPLVQHIAAAHPGCVFHADSTQTRTVALTLDDGPDGETTPRILDLLRKYDSHATFFLISSRIPGNDSLVIRMLQEGNEIGNHMSRNEMSILLSPSAFESSLLTADTALKKFTTPRWMRPGSGWYDARMISTARRHGYECALGSVYPFDPQIPVASHSVRVILGQVRPGSIIILHDGGYKGRNTVQVLSRLLPELARRGYNVVTLSSVLPPG